MATRSADGATPGFARGFDDLDREVQPQKLRVLGTLPQWLHGALLRNGPAKFDTGRRSFNHWFDGQAMLHRFAFANGQVSYVNRFLDTASSRSVRQRGRISYPEFATDPCASLFQRFFTRFSRKATLNASVNIAQVGERFVALTETPMPVEFEPETLATAGVVPYQDGESGPVTTAHPHTDPAGEDLVNYVLRFGRDSAYRIYRQSPDGFRRRVIASIPVRRPAYMHSFGITENHVVLAEFPLLVNPLDFVLRGKPFIANYRWRPERGTRFIVLDARDGALRGTYETPAFFAFHHINAYEEGSELVVDVAAYDDAEIVDALYLDNLRRGREVPVSFPTRYRIDLRRKTVTVRRLSDEPLELPGLHYESRNGHDYRFAYGVGARGATGVDFTNQLVKVDTVTGAATTWFEEGSYPGEPVFVPHPDAGREDAGVVLSVVLAPSRERSYLLVLDAPSFQEVARAEAPHAIPFGFHGRFTTPGRGV